MMMNSKAMNGREVLVGRFMELKVVISAPGLRIAPKSPEGDFLLDSTFDFLIFYS